MMCIYRCFRAASHPHPYFSSYWQLGRFTASLAAISRVFSSRKQKRRNKCKTRMVILLFWIDFLSFFTFKRQTFPPPLPPPNLLFCIFFYFNIFLSLSLDVLNRRRFARELSCRNASRNKVTHTRIKAVSRIHTHAHTHKQSVRWNRQEQHSHSLRLFKRVPLALRHTAREKVS